MIIPIRCFTCGGVVAHKYERYTRMVRLCPEKSKKVVFEEVGLHRPCCRTMVLSHVDYVETALALQAKYKEKKVDRISPPTAPAPSP
jgi:DNA-directed RNA polymerase subunit N (RpoN/RPB10)